MATEVDERLCELAKREMNTRGWTQKQLGEAMQIMEPEISLLMSKKRRWTIQLINKFTKATGLKVEI